MNQNEIFNNPQYHPNSRIAQNNSKSNKYTNCLITEMSGDPIQKVAKLNQKKRDKLKKFLYKGKEKGGYEYDKYKLQSGNGVSIEITPDYSFKKIMGSEKDSHNREIIDQINRNSTTKKQKNQIFRENERRNQK